MPLQGKNVLGDLNKHLQISIDKLTDIIKLTDDLSTQLSKSKGLKELVKNTKELDETTGRLNVEQNKLVETSKVIIKLQQTKAKQLAVSTLAFKKQQEASLKLKQATKEVGNEQRQENKIRDAAIELQNIHAGSGKSLAAIKHKIKQSTKALNNELKQEAKLEDVITDQKNLETEAGKRLVKEQFKLSQSRTKARNELKQEARLQGVAKDSLVAKRAELSKLTAKYDAASASIRGKMAPSIKNLSIEIEKAENATNRHQRAVGRYTQGFRKALMQIGLFAAGITAVFRGLGKLIGISSNFEQQMDKVQALTGKTSSGMGALKRSAQDLGKSTTKTATEVGQLQEELSKLGFKTDEILSGTGGILALAEATKSDLGKAAETAGATIRGFGKDATETNHVVDVMTKSFSTSALNLERYGVAMANVQVAAKATNKSFEFTTAALAKIVDTGTDASKAGTDLRTIYSLLAKEGLTMSDAYEILDNSSNKVVTAMGLVGKRAFSSLITLADNRKEVERLTEVYKNADGTAKKMADTMKDNLAGDITIAKSAWEGLVLSIDRGDGAISNAFRKVVQSFTKVVNAFTKDNDIVEELQNERTEVNSLVLQIGSLTSSAESRNEAYDKLLKIYPDILDGISREGTDTDKLFKVVQKYNKEIAQKIVLAQIDKREQELLAKQTKINAKIINEQTDIINALGKALSNEEATDNLREMSSAFIGVLKTGDIEKTRESFNNLSNEIVSTGDKIGFSFIESNIAAFMRNLERAHGSLENTIARDGDLLNELKNRKKIINELISVQKEYNTATTQLLDSQTDQSDNFSEILQGQIDESEKAFDELLDLDSDFWQEKESNTSKFYDKIRAQRLAEIQSEIQDDKEKRDKLDEEAQMALERALKLADEKQVITESEFEQFETNLKKGIEFEELSAKAKKEIAQSLADYKKVLDEGEIARTENKRQLAIDGANKVFNTVSSIIGREEELTARKYDNDIARAEKAGKDTEKIEQKKAIEIAKIQRKQAIADKATALFNIALSAPNAAAKITAQTGIGAPIAVPIAIGFIAAQAIAVAATPLPELPSFKEGTKKGQTHEGLALIHGQEIIDTPQGKLMTNWGINEGRVMDLPAETRVISNADLVKQDIANMNQLSNTINFNGGMTVQEYQKVSNLQNEKLINGFKKSIANIPKQTYHSDGHLSIKKRNETINYYNNRY
jgi:hypothetical protein